MNASIGWLELLEDQSIFASGDTRKHDTYELEFNDLPEGITTLRLEALPDARLPKGGPGRAYYEGPKGDFFLSELRLIADGQVVKLESGSENHAKQWIGSGKPGAIAALDDDLQTGWSASGREGKPSQAMWQLAKPLTASSLTVQMDFSRHYSASLGRFRFSVAKRRPPPPSRLRVVVVVVVASAAARSPTLSHAPSTASQSARPAIASGGFEPRRPK